MTAIVRSTRNGNVTKITSDHPTKREFKQELMGNGFRVLGIFTDKQIAEIKAGSDRFNLTDAYEYIRQCV